VEGAVDGEWWTLRTGGAGVVRLHRAGTEAPIGEIGLSDVLRPDARASVHALRALGLEVTLLSGDNEGTARSMAAAADITDPVAGVGPEGKAERIRGYRAAGRRVLYAGDGLNDGPALAAADVGIAMAGGAASSVLVADGVISEEAVAPLLAGFRAARACRRVIDSNLRRSVAYNVLAVGAAAAGMVNPLVAALLMPLSSALVIRGAFRVERMVRGQES
jgi:P-type E1-E2 ATPase